MPVRASVISPSAKPPAPTSRRILGIDPGLQRTGYAVLRSGTRPDDAQVLEAGVIRLDRAQTIPQRLVALEKHISELLESHRPQILACEELYAHYRHPRTAILMGHARGVILLCAARAEIRVFPVAATHVKKLLTGSGRASKRQIQLAVTHALGLPKIPEPDDVADAIAIALSGMHLQHATDTPNRPTKGPRA